MSADVHAGAVRTLLVALIRAALTDDPAIVETWSAAARERHAAVRAAASEAGSVNLDGAWVAAMGEAEADARVLAQTNVSPNLPKISPIGWAELAAPGLDVEALRQKIRQSTATG